ncbi:MAG: hypothetical protein V1817_04285 [Candidatus Micrarchaeota archaeon]
MKRKFKLFEKEYVITKEKIFWSLTITIVAAVIFIFIIPFFKSTVINRFEPVPLEIGYLDVYLVCLSNDNFITENSQLICNLSTKLDEESSKSFFQVVDVIIHGFDVENTSKAVYGCHAKFFNVTTHHSAFLLCENSFFNNTFKPEKAGTYKFGVGALSAVSEGELITYDEVLPKFYKKELKVMSQDEAINLSIAEKSLLIAIISILIFLPSIIFEIRKFLTEK